MSGETFDVGSETVAPVGPYSHLFPYTAEMQFRADMSSQ